MKLNLFKSYSTPVFICISLLFSACSKEETPVIEPELGWFNGNIGTFGYNTLNSRTETFIETISYENGNYKFKFERAGTGYLGFTHQRLSINLNNVPQQQSFQLFEPYTNEKNNTSDGIYFYTKTADADGKNSHTKVYTTLKNKNSISVNIDSVDYIELRTPSLIGKIKGYLYEVENVKDSILVDATFRTQASR